MWTVTQMVVPFVTLAIGLFIGVITAKYFYKKQIQQFQKQFETMDKEQIKNMLSAFGQKPSEERVNRIVESMNKKKIPNKKKK